MEIIIREAQITDIKGMQLVRNSVKENALSNPALITDNDYKDYIIERGKGWVCEVDKNIVGFAIADLKDHSVWALFLHPDHERKGIGRRLHDIMLDWYFNETKHKLWLTTSPKTRAENFYKKAGWKPVGFKENGEIKFEMEYENSYKTKTS